MLFSGFSSGSRISGQGIFFSMFRGKSTSGHPGLCSRAFSSLWWWNVKFLMVKDVADVLVAEYPVNTRKRVLKSSHQNLSTFFTLKFRMSYEICHLVLTLGTISRYRLASRRRSQSVWFELQAPIARKELINKISSHNRRGKCRLCHGKRIKDGQTSNKNGWNRNFSFLAQVAAISFWGLKNTIFKGISEPQKRPWLKHDY